MHTYNETTNGSWTPTDGIFKGLFKYNASELNISEFNAVLFDGEGATLKRDCSVSHRNITDTTILDMCIGFRNVYTIFKHYKCFRTRQMV